jgi:predicted permease
MARAFSDAWRGRRARSFAAAIAWLPASLLDPIVNGWRERRHARPYTPEPEGASMIDLIRQDFGFAARVLRRQPGFAIAAVLTLALGIGATTAIFSVVDGVLLRPLGYRDPDRLGFVWTRLAWMGVPRAWINGYQISLMQDELRSVESLAAMRSTETQLTGDGQPEQVRVGIGTVNLFDVLGVRPELGRAFVPEEGREGNSDVAVLGHALFQGRFGGDRAIIGKLITLGGRSVKVIGVMSEDFRFHIHSSLGEPVEPDLWAPATWQFRSMPRDGFSYALLLRARPGATLVDAQRELDALGARLNREQYQERGFGWQITGVQDDLVRKTRPALLVLLGAVGMVLLIGCANVASLFLVRAAGRSREFALRAAIGAGRRRIVTQLLAESLLLAGSAALLGYGLAFAAVRALRAVPGAGLPRLYDVTVDGRILLFTMGVAVVCGIAFGLAPALRWSRPNLAVVLQEGARGSGGFQGQRLRSAFVVAEIALALVLLLGAVLLLRTFAALRGAAPGFEPAGVLTARFDASRRPVSGGPRHGGFRRAASGPDSGSSGRGRRRRNERRAVEPVYQPDRRIAREFRDDHECARGRARGYAAIPSGDGHPVARRPRFHLAGPRERRSGRNRRRRFRARRVAESVAGRQVCVDRRPTPRGRSGSPAALVRGASRRPPADPDAVHATRRRNAGDSR